MAFIEPCFGIGHNLSLICQMTSEDIKHQLIIYCLIKVNLRLFLTSCVFWTRLTFAATEWRSLMRAASACCTMAPSWSKTPKMMTKESTSALLATLLVKPTLVRWSSDTLGSEVSQCHFGWYVFCVTSLILFCSLECMGKTLVVFWLQFWKMGEFQVSV